MIRGPNHHILKMEGMNLVLTALTQTEYERLSLTEIYYSAVPMEPFYSCAHPMYRPIGMRPNPLAGTIWQWGDGSMQCRCRRFVVCIIQVQRTDTYWRQILNLWFQQTATQRSKMLSNSYNS